MKNIKKNYIKWISKALSGLVVLSYLIATALVLKTGLVPNKYLLAILPLSALAVAGLVYGLIKDNAKNKYKSIGLVLASLGMIAVSIYTALLGARAYGLLSSIQEGEYTEIEYSIVAKKDSGVELRTNNKNIGYISEDTNKDQVLAEVKKRTSAEPVAYKDLANVVTALDTNKVTTDVFRSSYLQLLQDNYSTFYQSIKVLDTFKIKVKKDSNKTKTDVSKPFIVYISGIDTYGDISSVSRSDVNILAVINPQTKKILLVNTPRDYYVQLNGTTGLRDKLTHAGIYGVDVSERTLEDLYDVDINNYMRINFTSLMEIVDRIGGVEVNSDVAFKSGKYTFNQGINKLDGKAALEFSRNRYAFAEGDRQRGKNQQKVIEAIINKVSRPDTIIYYQSLLSSLKGTFQTDASQAEISAVVKQQLNSLGDWTVESVSVDGAGKLAPTYSYGSQPLYVMEPNLDTLNAAKAKIQEYLKY